MAVGVTGFVPKTHVTPVGSGVTHDRVTNWAVPLFKVTVMVFAPELPWTMLTGPEFDSE